MKGSKKKEEKPTPHEDSRIKQALRSVRFTVWIYFAIFIISILIIMWVTFTATFQANYRSRKNADISYASQYIVTGLYDGTLTPKSIYEIGSTRNLCIILQDRYGLTRFSCDVMSENCLIHGASDEQLQNYRRMARESKDGIYTEETGNALKVNTMLYVQAIGGKEPIGYLLINTTLEPFESTVELLRHQMLQISICMLVLGFGISVFLSSLLSTPITRITKSASRLAKGDFNVEFNGNGYTETEQLAETLNYASSEITKIDTMRRDLMANISHDLRTPLTMVKAYAEMIRDLSGDDPVKREEHLEIIIEESDRLSALVNDILDLTKLENGSSGFSPEKVDLHDRIYGIMNRYTLISEKDGYNFYVNVPEGLYIKADPIKLDQVIYNLVNNAVNYSGDSRDIYICAVPKTEHPGKIEVSVTDTGEGIPKEQLGVIFDRYYRAEKHKRDKIGTGLGLSIVKQVLIMHGFQFGVRSEEGVGSTFWFTAEEEKDEGTADQDQRHEDT
ncbi:MAG: HAMP domain-containing histidine kinase [Oscillospiraceae bacterium]|nr:HAMP domain-containing histidine kinase [Oscillospiraceae bacterium]